MMTSMDCLAQYEFMSNILVVSAWPNKVYYMTDAHDSKNTDCDEEKYNRSITLLKRIFRCFTI